MAGKIEFLPSGKTVTAHGHDSVLQSSLKAGMSLSYRCSNGNCGECKAVLRSGALNRLRHHDYLFSDAQKGQGYFLMCSNAPDGDISVEAAEVDSIAHIPEQSLTAKIKSFERVDSQVMLLHLRGQRSKRLQFLAGQSVELGGNDGIPKGIFPIASCPCDETSLLFHIPDMPSSDFAQYVFSEDFANHKKLDIRGPIGQFRFNESRERSVIFIAWHTGFAPIKAIIENVISLRTAKNIHLFRVSPLDNALSQAQRHYMDNYCRSWADALHNFDYHPMDERFKLISSQQEAVRIGEKILENFDDLSAYDFYIVGPPPFKQGIEEVILQAKLPKSEIKTCDICMGLL